MKIIKTVSNSMILISEKIKTRIMQKAWIWLQLNIRNNPLLLP